MKDVAGTLKIGLAQYRDMQAFAMFASDLDATSRRQLERGVRLTELLRQPQYSPYPVEDQVVSVWAGLNGLIDDVPVADVLRFEQEMLEHLRSTTQILQTIAETLKFDADTQNATKSAIESFKGQFRTSDGQLLRDEDQHVHVAREDIHQEEIIATNRKAR
jgi:F-type H+/Na+-transporting ATPase subunit alpha